MFKSEVETVWGRILHISSHVSKKLYNRGRSWLVLCDSKNKTKTENLLEVSRKWFRFMSKKNFLPAKAVQQLDWSTFCASEFIVVWSIQATAIRGANWGKESSKGRSVEQSPFQVDYWVSFKNFLLPWSHSYWCDFSSDKWRFSKPPWRLRAGTVY